MTEPNAALFVDGANWTRSVEALNKRIDYNRVVKEIEWAAQVKVVSLHYYTAFQREADLLRRKPFLEVLARLGWQVQAMPATQGVDGIWRDKEVDVAIALDAYEEVRSGKVNALLVGSGDEDFAALFRRLPEDFPAWAVGFRGSMSRTLYEVTDVILINDLNVLKEPGYGMGRFEGVDLP